MRIRRLLLGAAAAVTAAAAGATGLPSATAATRGTGAADLPAAPAATSDASPLAISLSSVSPAALAPGTTLTVSGRLRNTTTGVVRGATVSLRERGPLTTRDQVAQWRDAGPQDDRGYLLHVQRISEPLAAGATVPFSFSVPAASLGLDPAAAVPEAVGLAVSADGSSTGRVRRHAGRRPDLHRVAAPSRRATDQAERAGPGHAAGRRCRRRGGGRAPENDLGGPGPAQPAAPCHCRHGRLLGGRPRPARLGVRGLGQWLDPGGDDTCSIPQPVAEPSPSSSPNASAGSPAAAGWLQAFIAGARGRDVSVLPWADPDVVAVARAKATDLLTQADAAGASAFTRLLHRQPSATVTLPESAHADATTVRNLARSGRTVVLDSGTIRSTEPIPGGRADLTVTVRQRPTVAPTVVSDRALSEELAAVDQGAVAMQALLADLAVAASEHPGQSLLATTPRGWNPDPAAARRTFATLHAAGWVDLQPYSGLSRAARRDRRAPSPCPTRRRPARANSRRNTCRPWPAQIAPSRGSPRRSWTRRG